MNETYIINNLKKIIKNKFALKLNDDIFFDSEKKLLASIDTYNESIHYPNFENPDLLIKKVIRSSISDIIAKGADPKYILMSFSGSKKNFNKQNLKKILKSISQEQSLFNFSLIGGDTTGSIKSSFTICVFSYSNKIIKRSTFFNSDDIYVTGNIGDSSVGLSILKNKLSVETKYKKYFIDKFFKPKLAYGFHRDLHKFATSSMDVSDGILIDLKKLIGDKKSAFIIDYNLLPQSHFFKKMVNTRKISLNDHLFNGDDYQILFTAKKKHRNMILNLSKKRNQKVTRIGYISKQSVNYLIFKGRLKKIKDYQGYIHNFN